MGDDLVAVYLSVLAICCVCAACAFSLVADCKCCVPRRQHDPDADLVEALHSTEEEVVISNVVVPIDWAGKGRDTDV